MNASVPGGPVSRADELRQTAAAAVWPSQIEKYLIGVGSTGNLPGEFAVAAVEAGNVLQQGESVQPFFLLGPGAAFFAACIGHSSATSLAVETTRDVATALKVQCTVATFQEAASSRVRKTRPTFV
jgi:hypothetical protein